MIQNQLVNSVKRLGWFDMTLVVIFVLGMYLNVALQLTKTIPFPNAPAGIVGILMLWRQRHRITQMHVNGLLLVVLVYLVSMFVAPDPLPMFGKRFTGFVQVVYSIVISYGFFMTLTQASRKQAARVFFWFCVFLIVGSLLESYSGLRGISDQFRAAVYRSSNIYDADLRDVLIYGRIRPKLFTSEPSYVTFAFTLFAFAWFMFSEWRWKLMGYLALIGAGQLAMPGPTLLLALTLVVPYELFLGGRARAPGIDVQRLFKVGALGLFLGTLFVILGMTFYAARIKQFNSHGDTSFFFREIGPALVAKYVVAHYPIAGAGLTSERFITNAVLSVYEHSPLFSNWQVANVAEALTNYFWLHWIYMGLLFGILVFVAFYIWLRTVGVGSPFFCFAIWVVMGQSIGAYVGPRTWFVMLLAAAGAVMHRQVLQYTVPASPAAMTLQPALSPMGHRIHRGRPRLQLPG